LDHARAYREGGPSDREGGP